MKASSDNRVIPFAINGQAEAKEMGKAVLSSSSSVAHLPAPIKVYRRKLRRRRQIIQEAFDIFDLDRSGSISKNELRTILKLLDAPTDKGTIYHAAKKMKMKKGRISKSNFTRSFSLFTMGGRIEYSEDSIRANGLARVHKDKAEDKGNHNATGDNDGIGNDGDTEHGGGNGDGGQAYGDVKGKYTSIHRSDAPLILSVLDFDLALEIHLSTRLVQMREERHQKKRARSTIKAHANADTVTHLPFNRNSTMTRVGVTTAATDSDINNNSNKNKNKTYSTGSSSSSNSNTNTSDSGKSNRKNDSTSAAQVPRTSLSVNALERYDTLTLYNIDPDMISESESEEEEGQGRAHASFSKTHPLLSLPPVELLKERDRVVAKAILTPLGILYSAMIKGRVHRLKQAFSACDHDNSGSISTTELRSVFFALGEELDEENWKTIFRGIDENDDGQINFLEFLQYMAFRNLNIKEDDTEDRDGDEEKTTERTVRTYERSENHISRPGSPTLRSVEQQEAATKRGDVATDQEGEEKGGNGTRKSGKSKSKSKLRSMMSMRVQQKLNQKLDRIFNLSTLTTVASFLQQKKDNRDEDGNLCDIMEGLEGGVRATVFDKSVGKLEMFACQIMKNVYRDDVMRVHEREQDRRSQLQLKMGEQMKKNDRIRRENRQKSRMEANDGELGVVPGSNKLNKKSRNSTVAVEGGGEALSEFFHSELNSFFGEEADFYFGNDDSDGSDTDGEKTNDKPSVHTTHTMDDSTVPPKSPYAQPRTHPRSEPEPGCEKDPQSEAQAATAPRTPPRTKEPMNYAHITPSRSRPHNNPPSVDNTFSDDQQNSINTINIVDSATPQSTTASNPRSTNLAHHTQNANMLAPIPPDRLPPSPKTPVIPSLSITNLPPIPSPPLLSRRMDGKGSGAGDTGSQPPDKTLLDMPVEHYTTQPPGEPQPSHTLSAHQRNKQEAHGPASSNNDHEKEVRSFGKQRLGVNGEDDDDAADADLMLPLKHSASDHYRSDAEKGDKREKSIDDYTGSAMDDYINQHSRPNVKRLQNSDDSMRGRGSDNHSLFGAEGGEAGEGVEGGEESKLMASFRKEKSIGHSMLAFMGLDATTRQAKAQERQERAEDFEREKKRKDEARKEKRRRRNRTISAQRNTFKGVVHVLSEESQAQLRQHEIITILFAALAGMMSGLLSFGMETFSIWLLKTDGLFSLLGYDDLEDGEDSSHIDDTPQGLTFWQRVLCFWLLYGVTSVAFTFMEVFSMYFINLRMSIKTSKAANLVLFPVDKSRALVIAALARASLELPNSTESDLGVDPLSMVTKHKLMLYTLMLKGKRGLTTFILRITFKRVVQRFAVRALLPATGVIVNITWNSLIAYKCMRNARVISLGPSFSIESFDMALDYRLRSQDLEGGKVLGVEVSELAIRAIACTITGKQAMHPNLRLMLAHARERFDFPDDIKNIGNPDYFTARFRLQSDEDQLFLMQLFAVGIIADGTIEGELTAMWRTCCEYALLPCESWRLKEMMLRLHRGTLTADKVLGLYDEDWVEPDCAFKAKSYFDRFLLFLAC